MFSIFELAENLGLYLPKFRKSFGVFFCPTMAIDWMIFTLGILMVISLSVNGALLPFYYTFLLSLASYVLKISICS